MQVVPRDFVMFQISSTSSLALHCSKKLTNP